MKMSLKMTLLFSAVTAFMILFNTCMSIESEIQLMMRSKQENLLAIADKMVMEMEQNISLMEYGIEEMAQNNEFMMALNTIFTLGESGENTPAYHKAQNFLSSALFHEPLNDLFYRVNIMTDEGFCLSSHFEKTEAPEQYDDTTRNTIAALREMHLADNNLNRKLVHCPHPDPWSIGHKASVYSVSAPAIYHGKTIGYFEVNVLTDDLSHILAAPGLMGFECMAIFDPAPPFPARVLYRTPGSSLSVEGIDFSSPALCYNAQGEPYVTVRTNSKWLGLNIYAAQRVDAYAETTAEILRNHTLAGLAIFAAATVLIYLFSYAATHSIRRLTHKVSRTEDHLLETSPLPHAMVTSRHDKEARDLEAAFDLLIQNLRKAAQNELILRESALRAQLNALQAQINPHFVYNTLNVISAKAMMDGNEDIIDICDRFAQMLRYSTSLQSSTSTLSAEMDHVRNYLLLAKARYEDKLQYTIHVPEEFGQLLLPKLSLQPIVENALSHGYRGVRWNMQIDISAILDGTHCLHLIVRDNGTGFEPAVLQGLQESFAQIESGEMMHHEGSSAHIGLVNTYRRLFYFSSGHIRMRLQNDDGAIVELLVAPQSLSQGGSFHASRSIS